jgi:hypothetical protein
VCPGASVSPAACVTACESVHSSQAATLKPLRHNSRQAAKRVRDTGAYVNDLVSGGRQQRVNVVIGERAVACASASDRTDSYTSKYVRSSISVARRICSSCSGVIMATMGVAMPAMPLRPRQPHKQTRNGRFKKKMEKKWGRAWG